MFAPRLTELLVAWSNGDKRAENALMTQVYGELRRMARRQLAREPAGVLQTTALAHELYLRLADQSVRWQNRAQFFATAAHLTRRILIDHARRRHCQRRGAGAQHVTLDEAADAPLSRAKDLLALEDALNALRDADPRKFQVVELRFYGGLSVAETADTLGVSEVTVMRDWSSARAWLHREIRRGGAGLASSPDTRVRTPKV
jgi:RNA polymerase sigma factor (TIGR02999 family)